METPFERVSVTFTGYWPPLPATGVPVILEGFPQLRHRDVFEWDQFDRGLSVGAAGTMQPSSLIPLGQGEELSTQPTAKL